MAACYIGLKKSGQDFEKSAYNLSIIDNIVDNSVKYSLNIAISYMCIEIPCVDFLLTYFMI